MVIFVSEESICILIDGVDLRKQNIHGNHLLFALKISTILICEQRSNKRVDTLTHLHNYFRFKPLNIVFFFTNHRSDSQTPKYRLQYIGLKMNVTGSNF